MGWQADHDFRPGEAPRRGEGLPGLLADFEHGEAWDGAAPSAVLAVALEAAAGPEGLYPGADTGALVGIVRQWAAIESWAAAGMFSALRAMMREDGQGRPLLRRRADLPDGWNDSLNYEIAAALAMGPVSAGNLAGLAWALGGRLPGIGRLLADGTITKPKARLIAATFEPLDEGEAARAEALILSELAGKTYFQVERLAWRAALAVAPDVAERRRSRAERKRARVTLFREESGAVGLSGRDLPTAQALSGHAHVLARAGQYEASGVFLGQTTSGLQALAYLHLLNGVSAEDAIAFARTAAPEPPDATGAPKDDNQDRQHGADGVSGANDAGDDAHASSDGESSGGDRRRDGDDEPTRAASGVGDNVHCGDDPGAGNDDEAVDESRETGAYSGSSDGDGGGPASDNGGSGDDEGGGSGGGGGSADGPRPGAGDDGGDGPGGQGGPGGAAGPGAPAGRAALPEVTVPLVTLLGRAERPGENRLLGPLDPALTRELAAAAARSPQTRWEVTIVDDRGYAVGHGVARPARGRGQAGPPGPPGPALAALAARVNIIVTETLLQQLAAQATQKARPRSGAPPGEWRFAPRALGDETGTWLLTLPGGRELTVRFDVVPTYACDHRYQVAAYEPGNRLRRLVQVRDQECTFPPCSRPARESDFEHAVPYDKGGRTDACNAGARSRRCHQVKQSPGWAVSQPKPGWHAWTTPTGRTYVQEPWRYIALRP
jgi:hypothetical protein